MDPLLVTDHMDPLLQPQLRPLLRPLPRGAPWAMDLCWQHHGLPTWAQPRESEMAAQHGIAQRSRSAQHHSVLQQQCTACITQLGAPQHTAKHRAAQSHAAQCRRCHPAAARSALLCSGPTHLCCSAVPALLSLPRSASMCLALKLARGRSEAMRPQRCSSSRSRRASLPCSPASPSCRGWGGGQVGGAGDDGLAAAVATAAQLVSLAQHACNVKMYSCALQPRAGAQVHGMQCSTHTGSAPV
jgi:hypothetical protein